MKKIDFLRVSTVLSLALAVHWVAFYGLASAMPAPRHAVVRIGPVEAVEAVAIPHLASRGPRSAAG